MAAGADLPPPGAARLPPMPSAAVTAHLRGLAPGPLGRAQAALAAGRVVLLEGDTARRLRTARALAAVAFPGHPLVTVAGPTPGFEGLRSAHVLYVDDVAALAPESVLALAALVDDRTTPVIAGTSGAVPDALVDELGAIALFCGPEPVVAREVTPPLAVPTAREQAPTPAATAGHLELVLTELAHELRNPFVTIKTFAEHLPDLLEDASLRARFAALAGEAIERMDGLLENVMAFARLEPPVRRDVDLGALLDALLGELGPELAARDIAVRRAGTTEIHCAADPEHLSYGLRNLFAGLAREVSPHEALLVDTQANGVVRLQFAAGGAEGRRLRQLLGGAPEGQHGDPTMLPLAFTLARAALMRGGGSLDLSEEPDGPTTLVVRLPTAA